MVRGSDIAPESASYLGKAILSVLIWVTVIGLTWYIATKAIEVYVNTTNAATGINQSDLSDANNSSRAGANTNFGRAVDQWSNIEDIDGFTQGGFGGVFSD